MKRIAALLAPALLAAAPAAPCAAPDAACRCARPPPPPDEAFEQAAVVFRGVVLDREPADGTMRPPSGMVHFRVLETWKGNVSGTLTLRNGATSCHHRLVTGEEYVVYAQLMADGKSVRMPIMCGNRTHLTEAAEEDLAFLREHAAHRSHSH